MKVGDRTIQHVPEMKASGMSFFGEGRFNLGPEAFASDAELTKTVLHELCRLYTTRSVAGVSGEPVAAETAAAEEFAEQSLQMVMERMKRMSR